MTRQDLAPHQDDRARELPAEVKPNDQTAKCKVCCGCTEKDEPTYETAEVNPTDQKVKVCCGCAEKDEPTYETAEVNPTDQKVKVCCSSAEKEKPTYETAEVKPTNQKPKGCCKCDEKPKEIVKEPPCQKIRDCTCAKHRAQELPADYKPINQKAKCKVCCGCAEKDKPTCETADVKPINQKPKVCCAEEDKPTCETADVKPDNQKAKCKVCCGCAEEDKPTCETADVKPNNQEVKGKVCCAEEDKPTCETADVKPNNQKSKCKAKQPTDDSQAPPTTQCPPTKDKTTEPDEAEKPRKLSCVRYISNLFSKKMKCMFEETPLEAFLKGLNADPGGRDDICCQTSRINEPRGPQASPKSQASLKPPVQVNRVLVSLPEAITYKHLPNTISIWSTALCATHTRKESYSSCDSSQTLCVRVGQSRVNRVFSVTNICSGKEMEKLRLAYFLLTAMEGRVRRVNINRLFS
ncbi:adhesive plaque matrix protein-like [Cydia pomonella]|uniref:adhesive plaque matrix protein-like n=1 Tax=Cydia pomonella TaxID=82600 RepID=UPI002ADD7A5A|nr:adhesive plaque matrix protein-like [Cydia pomonella]